MIELVRIVEHQSSLSSYRATQNEERALQLELLFEMTKPKNFYANWHPLIATPFRYPPPHPQGRFRPPYGRNVFYGSLIEETALYEYSFYLIKQRRHLKLKTETGFRTIFFVDANDKNCMEINKDKNLKAIIDKNDYSASHEFISSHPKTTFIVYPSCRDPESRDNAAVFDIEHLSKKPKWEATIKFFYDNQKQEISWIDYRLHIQWHQVA